MLNNNQVNSNKSVQNTKFQINKSSLLVGFIIVGFNLFALPPIDFNLNASQNIDSRIASKHDPAINKKIYLSQGYLSGIYTRSTDCWAADLDLTCASPWNSRGAYLQAGTLITPRHAILAAHYLLRTGDSIRFITKDNITIRRKIIGFKVNTDFGTNSPDMEIVTLDSDVPPSITPCPILPANYQSYIFNNGLGLPVLYLDQEEKALVADVNYLNSGSFYSLRTPTNSNRLSLNESLVMGDSGNPVFLVINGKLVLVGVITWGGAGSGNSLAYYANLTNGGIQPEQNINDLIKETDAVAGINTGYKITLFDFNASTGVQSGVDQNNEKVYSVGRTLFVKSSFNLDMQVDVFDLFGHRIFCKSISDNLLSLELPTSGIYLVSLRSLNIKKIFKVIIQ